MLALRVKSTAADKKTPKTIKPENTPNVFLFFLNQHTRYFKNHFSRQENISLRRRKLKKKNKQHDKTQNQKHFTKHHDKTKTTGTFERSKR